MLIRPARVADIPQMARVHVRCWQETYRGLMPDAVLDDPGFPAARERQACLLHIGLDAMACNAYRGPARHDDLARTASQVSELL